MVTASHNTVCAITTMYVRLKSFIAIFIAKNAIRHIVLIKYTYRWCNALKDTNYAKSITCSKACVPIAVIKFDIDIKHNITNIIVNALIHRI